MTATLETRQRTRIEGRYFSAAPTAGVLCLGAAALCLLIPRRAPVDLDEPLTVETGSL